MIKCNNCGVLNSENGEYCCNCGTKLPKPVMVKLGGFKFSIFDIIFIIICNISFVLVVINLIVGGECWCHYPVIGLYFIYFIAFSCAARTTKRFLTRYRNTVMMMNFICGVFALICNALHTGNTFWVYDYFIPCNIIAACLVMVLLLIRKDIYMRNVLISVFMLSFQSLVQFIFMLCKLTAQGNVSQILSSVAFGLNVITLVNLIFLYIIKYKNNVVEKFRIWE